MRRISTVALGLMLATLTLGGSAMAQDGTDPSPSPAASPGVADTAPESAVDPTLEFEDPRWRKITPSRGPDPREDHTWTVDGDGRYAYMYGGRDGSRDFGDLWRYDLRNDTWKRLSPGGPTPDARFGHSAVWVDDIGLVIFAGQKGFDFFDDLWAFDPTAERWRQLPGNGAAPRARYGSCMIVGRDGRVWISHGFTFAGRFDDTRAYNFNTRRWASIAPDGRRPGERCLHECWTSSAGELVLYGGQDDDSRALGDQWVTRRNGTWKREDAPRAKARRLPAVTEAGAYTYVFGGADKADAVLDDLWKVDRSSHAFKRVRVDGNGPSARSAATLITDVEGRRLLLFGGEGASARGDVWELFDRAAPAATDAGDEADAGAADAAADDEAAPQASAEPAVDA